MIFKFIYFHYLNAIQEVMDMMKIEIPVDEYIENQTFVQENGDSVSELPSKKEIKWWFQDKADEINDPITGEGSDLYEVNVDQICLDDKTAHYVYTDLYNYQWQQGDIVDPVILDFIKFNSLAEKSRDKNVKMKIRTKLYNIALVGTIRFYHMERKPYLTIEQMELIEKNFIKYLKIIDKVSNGEYKDQKVTGSIYIFSGLKELN
jgi:hypothetical protein